MHAQQGLGATIHHSLQPAADHGHYESGVFKKVSIPEPCKLLVWDYLTECLPSGLQNNHFKSLQMLSLWLWTPLGTQLLLGASFLPTPQVNGLNQRHLSALACLGHSNP